MGREEKVPPPPKKVKAGWGEGSRLSRLYIKQDREIRIKDERSMGLPWEPENGDPETIMFPVDPKVYRARNWI